MTSGLPSRANPRSLQRFGGLRKITSGTLGIGTSEAQEGGWSHSSLVVYQSPSDLAAPWGRTSLTRKSLHHILDL